MGPTDGRTPTLSLYRHGPLPRIVGSALMVGMVVMGLVFAELIFRTEVLRCEPPQLGAAACTHVSSWPFVAAHETPLSPVVTARTRESVGRRGRSVTLLLEHADRTVSQYVGVGPLGERAETVALRIRDHLETGRQTLTLLLRTPNEALGIALTFVFCVLPLLSDNYISPSTTITSPQLPPRPAPLPAPQRASPRG